MYTYCTINRKLIGRRDSRPTLMDELAGIFFLSRSVTLRARSKKRVTKFVSDPADPVSEIRMHFEFIRLDVLSRNIRERRSRAESSKKYSVFCTGYFKKQRRRPKHSVLRSFEVCLLKAVRKRVLEESARHIAERNCPFLEHVYRKVRC